MDTHKNGNRELNFSRTRAECDDVESVVREAIAIFDLVKSSSWSLAAEHSEKKSYATLSAMAIMAEQQSSRLSIVSDFLCLPKN